MAGKDWCLHAGKALLPPHLRPIINKRACEYTAVACVNEGYYASLCNVQLDNGSASCFLGGAQIQTGTLLSSCFVLALTAHDNQPCMYCTNCEARCFPTVCSVVEAGLMICRT